MDGFYVFLTQLTLSGCSLHIIQRWEQTSFWVPDSKAAFALTIDENSCHGGFLVADVSRFQEFSSIPSCWVTLSVKGCNLLSALSGSVEESVWALSFLWYCFQMTFVTDINPTSLWCIVQFTSCWIWGTDLFGGFCTHTPGKYIVSFSNWIHQFATSVVLASERSRKYLTSIFQKHCKGLVLVH